MSKISEFLPEFIAEAQASPEAQGRTDLAEQLAILELSRWTYDAEEDAMYLYLSGQAPLNIVEQNIIGIRHGESIKLDALEGWVVIDTDNFDRIRGIEVLWRQDVAEKLKGAMAPNN